jgi:hypothetical protein
MSHAFRSLHGGKACLALVPGGIRGDLCGQPADHPIHQVPNGNDRTCINGHPLDDDGQCPYWCDERGGVTVEATVDGRLREAALPYAGTSGWSGSETSRSTVVDQDNDGRTLDKQQRILELMNEHVMVPFDDEPLYRGRSYGLTWRECDRMLGWGHGSLSRVLSDLHKAGLLARLSEVRNRCKVYVLPEYVGGRETEPHGGRGGVDEERVRAEERHRIVWWLRAAVDGPAAVNVNPARLATIREIADVIEQHPERFADAPPN